MSAAQGRAVVDRAVELASESDGERPILDLMVQAASDVLPDFPNGFDSSVDPDENRREASSYRGSLDDDKVTRREDYSPYRCAKHGFPLPCGRCAFDSLSDRER